MVAVNIASSASEYHDECMPRLVARSSLYIQKIELSDENMKARPCSCISFRPLQSVKLDHLHRGSHHVLRMNKLFQLAKLEQFLYQNQLVYQGHQVILVVFPSVLTGIEKELLVFARRLAAMHIELVVDVVQMDSALLGTVSRLAEQGIIFSMGQVEWQQLTSSNTFPGGQWFQFARVAAPTPFAQEVELFLDLTFELRERFGLRIIVDRLQSRTQLQIAKRTPYFGLLGDYISRAKQLEVGERNVEPEGIA